MSFLSKALVAFFLFGWLVQRTTSTTLILLPKKLDTWATNRGWFEFSFLSLPFLLGVPRLLIGSGQGGGSPCEEEARGSPTKR